MPMFTIVGLAVHNEAMAIATKNRLGGMAEWLIGRPEPLLSRLYYQWLPRTMAVDLDFIFIG